VLRGSTAEKVKQMGHHHLSTYGIGKDQSEAYWRHLAWQLIHREYCYQDTEHFNVIRLNAKAKDILLHQAPISLTELPPDQKTPGVKRKAHHPSMAGDPLFERLRALRRRLAEEESKPSFLIFSDATLHDMMRVKPQTIDQMLLVSGVGQRKLTQYGHYFLELLKETNHDSPTHTPEHA